MTKNYLSKLFEPIKIGEISVRNRVVMPAMATFFATDDGFVTDQMISYYAERAKGGVGLIIVEATYIDDPIGKCIPNEVCIDDDKYIPGLSKLAAAVHSCGGKIAVQLHHAGPNTHLEGGAQPVAPSPIPLGHKPHIIPRELSKKEIKEIAKKFALGARRAKQADFDAVELLCAHGYLLNRFLSPHANRRKDEYGGTLEGRVRIVREIVEGIKEEAGENLGILCKVPGDDYVDGGITLEESIGICKILEKVGVNLLTITGGSGEGRFSQFGMGFPQGWQVHLAVKVKGNVRVPIAAMGKIKDPEFAERILHEGQADMVAIGRSLIADPDLVGKAQRNETDNIIPCITCNHCLDRTGFERKTLRCSVNPLTGREYDIRLKAAAKPRKILVVGGGPAGMEAASIAALRGHHVTLVEKGDRLGGQLLLASMPPDKEEITTFIDHLHRQVKEKGVDVRLKMRGSREVFESVNADVVIAATGASPLIPSIPGVNGDNVMTAWEALLQIDKVENNVIVIGGGLVGCEVALFLSKNGRKVTIVEQLDEVGLDIGPSVRKFEMKKLLQAEVTILVKTLAKEITKEGVAVDQNGQRRVLTTEAVVLAVGAKSDRELLEALEATKAEVYVIGDSVAPRRIVHAMWQGFLVGSNI